VLIEADGSSKLDLRAALQYSGVFLAYVQDGACDVLDLSGGYGYDADEIQVERALYQRFSEEI
jgi:hypothetical protein